MQHAACRTSHGTEHEKGRGAAPLQLLSPALRHASAASASQKACWSLACSAPNDFEPAGVRHDVPQYDLNNNMVSCTWPRPSSRIRQSHLLSRRYT